MLTGKPEPPCMRIRTRLLIKMASETLQRDHTTKSSKMVNKTAGRIAKPVLRKRLVMAAALGLTGLAAVGYLLHGVIPKGWGEPIEPATIPPHTNYHLNGSGVSKYSDRVKWKRTTVKGTLRRSLQRSGGKEEHERADPEVDPGEISWRR